MFIYRYTFLGYCVLFVILLMKTIFLIWLKTLRILFAQEFEITAKNIACDEKQYRVVKNGIALNILKHKLAVKTLNAI